MNLFRLISALLCTVPLLGLSTPARAAESYDNCTFTITSLPAVLSTPGVWCLKQDLSTNMTSGIAIDVQSNNVTVDCNGFKLGGLGGGPTSTARGIQSEDRANTTVLPHRRVERLVTHGAFRFRRNPIYMGEVLVFLGLAQATGNIWMAIMAPLFALGVFALAILPEERHLEARFGDAYVDYKAGTRRWF